MSYTKQYCVYIMSNKGNTTFYTGVTSNLFGRVGKHKNKTYKDSFTARYNATKLVYCERFGDVQRAIGREKQIKAGSREKKLELIKKANPGFNDLAEDWYSNEKN